MKAIKKKIFSKAMFLFLAFMLVLAPMTLGALAAEDEYETDECYTGICAVEDFILVEIEEEEYTVVTMSTCTWVYCHICTVTFLSCHSSCPNDIAHRYFREHGAPCRS